MSADNWTQCPRCSAKARAAFVAKTKTAAESYGKVPPSQYTRLMDEIARGAPEMEDTFREDYDIGLRDGEFTIDYHGRCGECGLKHVFKHVEKVSP
jgi:hypothetical protein